jgi:(2Fe-2S) ferredoxin
VVEPYAISPGVYKIYAESVRESLRPSYVVVCRGPHCRERGGMPLRQRLVRLLRGSTDVRLVGYACFGCCELGPNVALYPEGVWFGGLTHAEDAERIVQHALGERRLDQTPLEVPDRASHLANIAELVDTLERDQLRARGPWWRRLLALPSRG